MSSKMDKGQQKAIKHNKGPVLVLAGPGSGKTTVITHRLKYLLEEKNIDPSTILVVTFTKNAATEMQTRAISLCGDSINNATFGTFHAITFSILREEKGLAQEDVMPNNLRREIVKNLCTKYFPDRDDKKTFLNNALLDISLAQSKKEDIETFIPNICSIHDFIPFFEEYRQLVKNTGLITYDDMLFDCVELLENNKNVLKKWKARWEYILVDEYQDANPIQERFLELLAYPKNNIMVVGDDDQSIYGFRGADPKVMLDFPKTFKKAKEIHLETNYRSTNEIVLASKLLIRNNSLRYDKDPVAHKGSGQELFIKRESNADWQGKTIVKEIKKLKSNGVPYKEIALIFRTNRETGAFVEILTNANIPFHVNENIDNIYEHWIAKDIFSYIQFALGIKSENLLKQIINRPKRYVEKEVVNNLKPFTLENLKRYYNDLGKSYIVDSLDKLEKNIELIKEHLQNNNTFEALDVILNKIGYMSFLEERAKEIHISIEELNGIVDELSNAATKHPNITEWFSYIKSYTKEINNKNSGIYDNEDCVELMTMHASKGLEFIAVFLPNLVEGQVPSSKAKTQMEIEEERRMFYVAMTRAKDYLYLISLRNYNGKEVEQTRFIKEIRKGLERIKLDEAKQLILDTAEKFKHTSMLDTVIKESEENKKNLKTPLYIPKEILKDTKVLHKDFGEGYVQEINPNNENKLKIYFVKFGKTFVIDKEFQIKNGLLNFVKDYIEEKSPNVV